MERVVLVGSGGFGRCWWPALTRMPDRFEVVGVVEPDPAARAAAGRHFDLAPDRLRAPGEFDWTAFGASLVIDSSPFPHHPAHLRRAVAAGLDVLVAKPMAPSLAEATEMVDRARAAGSRLAVAQQMRYFPCFLALRTLLATRVAGDPVAVRVRMALDGRGWEPGTDWRLRMRHPLLFEAAIHHFDLLRWVFGTEFTDVAALTWNPPWSPFTGDATAVVLMRGENGIGVDYSATFAPGAEPAVRFDSGWEVLCTDGTLTVRDGSVLLDNRVLHAAEAPDPVSLEELNTVVLREWATATLARAEPAFNGADNLHSLALVEAAARAADRSPRPVGTASPA